MTTAYLEEVRDSDIWIEESGWFLICWVYRHHDTTSVLLLVSSIFVGLDIISRLRCLEFEILPG